MSWIQARLDRLRQIVAVCLKNNLNPNVTGFSDYVINYIASNYGLRPQTAREHVKTLIDAWHHNAWNSYIKHNPYLTEEEKQKWIKKPSKPP